MYVYTTSGSLSPNSASPLRTPRSRPPAPLSVRRLYPPPVDGHVPKFYLILLGTTSFTIRYDDDDTHARTLLNAA